MIGYAFTGSFCTIAESIAALRGLVMKGYDVVPIMSENAYSTDTRFGKAGEVREQIFEMTGREPVHTIVDAEPFGPKLPLDAMLIAPCTGNTLAKLANGITDTAVCMAAKAHLRNNKPLLIALASNDALSANLKNIATLLSRKNVYFVPMKQDDPVNKPHSLVADFSMIDQALESALNGTQIAKLFI